MLATTTVEEKIEEMVRMLVEQFEPDKIILFGSHARKTADADSDVDLLVIKPITGSKRRERIAMGVALQGMGQSKDIVVYTPEEVAHYGNVVGTLLYPALREGKVLYERSSA